jgi:hypothetical protein
MKFDPPKWMCDICDKKPAQYWFGQTSVALCGDEECSRINQEHWAELINEEDEE